jgi:hypothetical protein
MRCETPPSSSKEVTSSHPPKLQPPASKKLNRREIWIEVERLISYVKQHYASLGWVNMLDPWIARNTEYFIWEDVGKEPRD